jgi:hypothetical protein
MTKSSGAEKFPATAGMTAMNPAQLARIRILITCGG